MGRLSAWSVGLFLAFAGSTVAHALTYAVVAPDAARRTALLNESGHAYLSYLPFVLGLMGALALVGLVARVVATERGQATARWPIALLPALTFVVQEHVERLGQNGALPWDAVLEPTFLPGLALQLPLGALAFVVARALLRGAAELGAILRTPARWIGTGHTTVRRIHHRDVVRVGAPATGRVTRGPPVAVAA